MTTRGILALEDGTVFHGVSIGAPGTVVGEVVFNTAMTGYQEILTDPSYAQQIVTLTYPHVGNVATNADDAESDRIQATGLVIRDASPVASNWRAEGSLEDYLASAGTPALAGVDTRRLTRLIRDHGAQRACLSTDASLNEEAAIGRAKGWPGLHGADLAKVVSTRRPYPWSEGSWEAPVSGTSVGAPLKVVAYDYGVKRNILRLLVDRGCEVEVVPADTPAGRVLEARPAGVFLSNGPGDPEPCRYAIEAIRALLDERIPLFGICLGHQLLCLAAGARTEKMKFGHHGANHPVRELATGRVLITSQNHGFAVAEESLPDSLVTTHRSLFDGTLQGVRHATAPAFSFQGHPEASPGPHDVRGLFDAFVAEMRAHAGPAGTGP